MRHPIALDERQMKMIMDAARSVPVARRDEFLHTIANHLGDTPTLIAVEAAIGAFFERLPAKEVT
jgi:hypothetical protein